MQPNPGSRDCYLNYSALTEKLHALADAHPDYLTLGSIGKSYEGREIWFLELTNQAPVRPAKNLRYCWTATFMRWSWPHRPLPCIT